MSIQAIRSDIEALIVLENKALSKQLYAAFGAYRRERNRLESLLNQKGQ